MTFPSVPPHLIGMVNLEFSSLSIEQGTGELSSHVVVREKATGEYLLIIEQISSDEINKESFYVI